MTEQRKRIRRPVPKSRPETTQAILAFEKTIGRGLRWWMIDSLSKGYSQRWMSEKSGLGKHVIQYKVKEWNLARCKPEKILRPHRPESLHGYAIFSRLKMDGYEDRNLYERVLKRMRNGMQYHEALQEGIKAARPGQLGRKKTGGRKKCAAWVC